MKRKPELTAPLCDCGEPSARGSRPLNGAGCMANACTRCATLESRRETNKPADFLTPSGDVISVAIEEITPALAAEWLATQTRNRKIRQRHLTTITRDMRRGDFAFTAAGISFDAAGCLIDGQHRLTAIVQSGVTVRLFVFRGFPSSAQDSMDLGAGRTAWEQAGMSGLANAHVTVSYLNAIASGWASYPYKLSLPQVRAMLEVLPRLAWAVSKNCAKFDFRSGIYLGPIALAIHLPKRADAKAAGDFHDRFVFGFGIKSEDDPAHRLRQFARTGVTFGGARARDTLGFVFDCIEAAVTARQMDRPTGTGRDWMRAALPNEYARTREILRNDPAETARTLDDLRATLKAS